MTEAKEQRMAESPPEAKQEPKRRQVTCLAVERPDYGVARPIVIYTDLSASKLSTLLKLNWLNNQGRPRAFEVTNGSGERILIPATMIWHCTFKITESTVLDGPDGPVVDEFLELEVQKALERMDDLESRTPYVTPPFNPPFSFQSRSAQNDKKDLLGD